MLGELEWTILGGTRKYEISYTIKDAIANYDDCSELYWKFVGEDFEINAKKITGTITLPQNVDKKSDIKVWGHTEDLNGEIHVTGKDKVEFEINRFRHGRFIELRIAIPEEISIYSSRSYNKTLQDIIDEETVWAEEANRKRERKQFLTNIVAIVICTIAFIIDALIIKQIIKNKEKLKILKKYKPTQKFEYFRDIPKENATPAEALYLLHSRTNGFYNSEIGNVFSATLLNLSLKKFIEFEVTKNEKNKEKITIKIVDGYNIENLANKDEKAIFEFLVRACKKDKSITAKELEKYIKSNSSKVVSLKSKIDRGTEQTLVNNGEFDKKSSNEKEKYIAGLVGYIFLIIFAIITSFIFGIVISSITLIGTLSLILVSIIGLIYNLKVQNNINVYTQNGVDEQEKWKGLKKYMQDFSMLDRREIPELAIWEKYLVYATAFGIADKVLKQLKIVYPEIESMNNFNTGIYMGMMMNTSFSSSFSNAISSSMSSAYSSGSGGGGGFSGGGGGGRPAGGGGGGR